MLKNFLLLIVMFSLCSCSIISTEPQKDVHYFDIGFPKKQSTPLKKSVALGTVSTVGNYYEKMVFRTAKNQLAIDEFNRWSSSPAVLLKRYLTIVLDSGRLQGDASHKLSLEILRFEADIKAKKVNLTLVATFGDIKKESFIWRKIYSETVPLQQMTAASYAEGMEKALDDVVQKILKDMAKVK